MIHPDYLSTLGEIESRLRVCRQVWAVTGSFSMALQGMDISVHDIDIQTSQRGAYEIESYFPEFIVQPVRYLASAQIRSHLGALEINGIKVEIMGDVQQRIGAEKWETPVNVARYRRWIEVEGMRIPVLSLAYEYQAYLKMGRLKKAEMLRLWLQP